MPRGPRRLTPVSRGRRAEADARVPGEALDVDDPPEGERVAPVLRVERDGSLARLGADIRGAENALERIGVVGSDDRTHHLAAVERDLDSHALLRQGRPPPSGRRGPRPDGRTRPRARRGPPSAPRRSGRPPPWQVP